MAATRLRRRELLEILTDVAGYKAGLVLSRAELLRHLDDHDVLHGELEDGLRVRLEEIDHLVRELLHALGVLSSPPESGPPLGLYAKYHKDPEASAILAVIQDEFWQCTKRSLLTEDPSNPGPIDITPVAERAAREFGRAGLDMFREFEAWVREYIHGSFASGFRRAEWTNAEQLKDLFDKACITPLDGTYLDQRYIDYLERNPAGLDAIHWRNFEAITAEFFARSGYEVELGTGQNDGGVDVRVWRERPEAGTPPTILVQCKRQRSKVGQVVVKALWADVVAEGAESGLVVTTSALQPGAAKVAIARSYAIREADGATIRQWLAALRTPGTGIAML